jgi:hypothetical protein
MVSGKSFQFEFKFCWLIRDDIHEVIKSVWGLPTNGGIGKWLVWLCGIWTTWISVLKLAV